MGTIHWRYEAGLKTSTETVLMGTVTVGDTVVTGTLPANPRYPALGSEPEFDLDRLSARVKTDSILQKNRNRHQSERIPTRIFYRFLFNGIVEEWIIWNMRLGFGIDYPGGVLQSESQDTIVNSGPASPRYIRSKTNHLLLHGDASNGYGVMTDTPLHVTTIIISGGKYGIVVRAVSRGFR